MGGVCIYDCTRVGKVGKTGPLMECIVLCYQLCPSHKCSNYVTVFYRSHFSSLSSSLSSPPSSVNGPSSPGDESNEGLGACAQVKPEMIDIYFTQDELEKANKDKKHFPPGFKVRPHMCISSPV